ncbi:MAG: carbohydrate ABC transporter permease [Oscillospiraceae bacterium]
MKKLARKVFNARTGSAALAYAFLCVAALLAAGPLVIIIFTSFKGQFEIVSNTAQLLPEKFTLYWYNSLLHKTDFLIYVKNSLVYSSLATLLGIAISSLAAYAITRYKGKKQKMFTRAIVMTYMFPPILLAIPYFMLVSALGLANTTRGLLMAYMSFTVPFCTYLLVSYFKTVPIDVEEAALIDGLTRPGVFFKISLPLVAPGVVATAIFAFINAWNEFLYSLLIISSGDKQTVSVGLYSLKGGMETLQWGDMMAASVLVVIPSIIFFSIIQKSIAAGLTAGAGK